MQNVAVINQPRISLVAMIKLFWARKITIISITTLFAIIGVALALYLPNKYTAEVMVIPSESNAGGGLSSLAGQFGGLAGMAGLNLSGGASKKPKIALQILKSRTFLIDFINKYDLKVAIFAVNGWDSNTDSLLINEKLYDISNQVWVRKFKFPRKLIPSDQEVYEKFSKMVRHEFDNREGTYRISVEYYSPKFAAEWANMLVRDVNEHMRKFDIAQSEKSIMYLNTQLENAKLHSTESVFFELIEEQTKKAMLAQVQEDYVFSIIDLALAPEKKSQPKRALICIFFVIFGGLLACGGVLIEHQVKSNKE